jgi:uncharacterized membrane protein
MKVVARLPQMILGFALAYAGIGHLTSNRQEFQAQVTTLFKDYADFVVLASGVVEIALGADTGLRGKPVFDLGYA